MKTVDLSTRGEGRSTATAKDFQRIAELHGMFVRAEENLSALNREYAEPKRNL